MIMNKPSATRHIVDSVRLPFEPSMEDMLKVRNAFVAKYYDRFDQKSQFDIRAIDKAIKLEDCNERCENECTDRFGCSKCDRGYNGYLALVFSIAVPNENYAEEMKAYIAEHRAAHELRQREKSEAEKRFRACVESDAARKAWKDLSRQERVSRRIMGRHTLVNNSPT